MSAARKPGVRKPRHYGIYMNVIYITGKKTRKTRKDSRGQESRHATHLVGGLNGGPVRLRVGERDSELDHVCSALLRAKAASRKKPPLPRVSTCSRCALHSLTRVVHACVPKKNRLRPPYVVSNRDDLETNLQSRGGARFGARLFGFRRTRLRYCTQRRARSAAGAGGGGGEW